MAFLFYTDIAFDNIFSDKQATDIDPWPSFIRYSCIFRNMLLSGYWVFYKDNL